MALVYLLSEDDFDDQVYVYVLEALLSVRVEPIPFRLRRGGGVGEVRKKLPLLVDAIRRSGPVDDTSFLIAIDNDRDPPHAGHLGTAPHATDCRRCRLDDAITERMPDGRPIQGAVAVPVEMIEAWLLLMYDPARYPLESTLPRCSRQAQPVARRLYGATPAPQLKDLIEAEQRACGITDRADFAMECVMRLGDPGTLAARSPSFADFRAQVSAWAPR